MPGEMWANAISHPLARVINFCFDKSSKETLESRTSIWQSLAADTKIWRDTVPVCFNPLPTAPKQGNLFPSIWLVRPWHGEGYLLYIQIELMNGFVVAGEQYFSVAEILLALAQPLTSVNLFGLSGRTSSNSHAHPSFENLRLSIHRRQCSACVPSQTFVLPFSGIIDERDIDDECEW